VDRTLRGPSWPRISELPRGDQLLTHGSLLAYFVKGAERLRLLSGSRNCQNGPRLLSLRVNPPGIPCPFFPAGAWITRAAEGASPLEGPCLYGPLCIGGWSRYLVLLRAGAGSFARRQDFGLPGRLFRPRAGPGPPPTCHRVVFGYAGEACGSQDGIPEPF